MVSWMYPTIFHKKTGYPEHTSLFGFASSGNLEELKRYAQERAVIEADQQLIVEYATGTYVLFCLFWQDSRYFKDKPIVARFAASGKETTRKGKRS